MSAMYEELDRQDTPIGEIVLRRRRVPGLEEGPIYEIKIDDDLLMSSLINESEQALAHEAIKAIGDGIYDVLVGGLGLGYTAWAALGYERVRSVTVIELLEPIIAWHEQGLVPLGQELHDHPRCRFLRGDFFVLVTDPSLRDVLHPAGGYGAILVDIDHAPDALLHATHAGFYAPRALARTADLLQPGGVLAIWSAGKPQEAFTTQLRRVFPQVELHEVEVYNPLADADQVDTLYVAKKAGTIPVDPPRRAQQPPSPRPTRR
ncbi:MAG: spermidine synthase [Planctomycetota bacterium]|nr:spermidine synthase [Planctomycetota bacterium]